MIIIQHNKISLTFFFLKTLSDTVDLQDEAHTEDKRLDQAEVALGDHVTGGVVQSWRRVQKRLGDILSEGKHSLISLFGRKWLCVVQICLQL